MVVALTLTSLNSLQIHISSLVCSFLHVIFFFFFFFFSSYAPVLVYISLSNSIRCLNQELFDTFRPKFVSRLISEEWKCEAISPPPPPLPPPPCNVDTLHSPLYYFLFGGSQWTVQQIEGSTETECQPALSRVNMYCSYHQQLIAVHVVSLCPPPFVGHCQVFQVFVFVVFVLLTAVETSNSSQNVKIKRKKKKKKSNKCE